MKKAKLVKVKPRKAQPTTEQDDDDDHDHGGGEKQGRYGEEDGHEHGKGRPPEAGGGDDGEETKEKETDEKDADGADSADDADAGDGDGDGKKADPNKRCPKLRALLSRGKTKLVVFAKTHGVALVKSAAKTAKYYAKGALADVTATAKSTTAAALNQAKNHGWDGVKLEQFANSKLKGGRFGLSDTAVGGAKGSDPWKKRKKKAPPKEDPEKIARERQELLERDQRRKSDLLYYCMQGQSRHHAKAKKVLQEMQKKQELDALNKGDEQGSTPFFVACSSGNAQLAELMLEYGADINAQDSCGNTPFLAAVYRGRVEVVRLLIDKGADLSMPNEAGLSPAKVAAHYGRLRIVRLLTEKGVKPGIEEDEEAGTLDTTTGMDEKGRCSMPLFHRRKDLYLLPAKYKEKHAHDEGREEQGSR